MKKRNRESDDPLKIEEALTALRESQEQYGKIIDEMGEGYTELDLAGTITFVNKASARMSNRAKDELVGRNYKQFVNNENIEKTYQAFHSVYTSKIPITGFIHDIVLRTGEKRTIEGSISLKETKGKVAGFRHIWHDITDRKRAEEELENQRIRLEIIFGSVKEGIIAVDTDGKLIDANKATESICGVCFKNLVGMPFTEVCTSCRNACQNVLRETLQKKTTVKEYQIECHRRGRAKQVVVVSSAPLVNSQGEVMGAVLVMRDVTKLLDLEKELRGRYQFQNLIGKSRKMQEIYNFLENLADVETTVLVTGESGTGKELVARALHYGGTRSFKPLVKVNCSALSENLLESELFGHVKGAFTGAIKDREGRFEAADGGTILLDEIGDISPLIQLKLLRVLQEKEFEPVGESTPHKVDVRVIACTNKDLKEKVARGEFREDLYYRLKVVEISLPPLREHLEDLPLLVDHFCRLFNEKFKKNIKGVSNEVLCTLMHYSWPGNVRELEHMVEHAFILCNERVITTDHLPSEIREHEGPEKRPVQKADGKAKMDREILDALNKTDWNKSKAARLLGINRRTIYRRIKKHHFTRPT